MNVSKLIDYMGNVAFDYSELQIIVRSVTSSDERAPCQVKVQKVIDSTFENSKNCNEIFDVIRERLNSNRSTALNIIKTLNLAEILLLLGSEKFISVATNEKELIRKLTIHQNAEVKQKAFEILKLETDRNHLFARRSVKTSSHINNVAFELIISSSENLSNQ